MLLRFMQFAHSVEGRYFSTAAVWFRVYSPMAARRPFRLSSRDTPKVAPLVETSRSFGREFLSDIVRYARHRGPWIFHITPGDFDHVVPKMKQWGGTGFIAANSERSNRKGDSGSRRPHNCDRAYRRTDESRQPSWQLPEVSSDADNVARLATEHFLERRLKHFAYVGAEDRAWSRRRGEVLQWPASNDLTLSEFTSS